MTSIEFIVRRLVKSLGICNKQTHFRTASRLTHLLTETEELIGSKAWGDVGDILELSENYWKIKDLVSKQDAIEQEAKKIKTDNEKLTAAAEKLEIQAKSRIVEINNKKTKSVQNTLELKNEIGTAEDNCELLKKKYSGLEMTLRTLDEPSEISNAQKGIDQLQTEYTKERQRIGKLKLQLIENNSEVKSINAKHESLLNETRNQMSEAMSQVSKSSKLVANHSAKIGSIDTTIRSLYLQIGSYLSAKSNSEDPELTAILKKHRIVLAKINQLQKSIQFHRILGS